MFCFSSTLMICWSRWKSNSARSESSSFALVCASFSSRNVLAYDDASYRRSRLTAMKFCASALSASEASLGVRRVEVQPHQPRVADRLHRQRAEERRGRRRVGVARRFGRRCLVGALVRVLAHPIAEEAGPPRLRLLLLRGGALPQVQLLDHALRQGPALQELVLRAVEIHVPRRLVGGHALEVDDLRRLALDLERRRRTVDRRRHHRRHQRGDEHDEERRNHDPLALDDDAPEVAEVDRVVLLRRGRDGREDERGQRRAAPDLDRRRSLGWRDSGSVVIRHQYGRM